MKGSPMLTAAVAVVGFLGTVATIRWLLRSEESWAIRRTRYGSVDQRWIIPIAMLADTAYAALGVQTHADTEYWQSFAMATGVQVALGAAWLGLVFLTSRQRRKGGG